MYKKNLYKKIDARISSGSSINCLKIILKLLKYNVKTIKKIFLMQKA